MRSGDDTQHYPHHVTQRFSALYRRAAAVRADEIRRALRLRRQFGEEKKPRPAEPPEPGVEHSAITATIYVIFHDYFSLS